TLRRQGSTLIRPRSLHDALPIYTSHSRGLPAVYSKLCSDTVPRCQKIYRLNLAVTPISKFIWWGMPEPLSVRNQEPLPLPEPDRSEEHTSELQSRENVVCRLLLE